MEARDAAKSLFLAGWEQNRIAKLLEVAPNSITAWKKAGAWEKKRTEQALAQETASERIWKLINHNLRVIEERTEQDPDKLIERGDIDALYKLFAAVKTKEVAWGAYITTARELMEYVQQMQLDLAKQLDPLLDEFLKQKRKDLA